MVLERAEILAKDGMADDFAAALKDRGIALLASHAGCRSVKLGRGVENPNKFMLLLEWDSIEAHIAATQTPAHAAFRELVGPFGAGGAMEHFTMG